MYYFITENSDDSYSYVVSEYTLNKRLLACKDIFCLAFEDIEEAKQYQREYVFKNAVEYTKNINFKPNKLIIAYVGDRLSPKPGFYKVLLNEFLVLQDYDIRLPTLSELENVKNTDDFVSIYSDIWVKISDRISEEVFYEENKIELVGNAINKKIARLFKAVINKNADLPTSFRRMFGNLEDDIIDKMINEFFKLVKEVKVNPELDYFYMRFNEIASIAKESKTIIRFMYL